MPKNKLLVALLLVCALFTQACTSSEISTVLNDVVKTSDVAELVVSGVCSILATADPATVTACQLANAYLTAANTASAACATEVASTDMQSLKWQTCVNDYAQAVIPNLPPGTNPAIADAIGALGSAIKALLDILQPPFIMASHPIASNPGGAFKVKEIQPSVLDRYRLHQAAKHFHANAAKASARLSNKK